MSIIKRTLSAAIVAAVAAFLLPSDAKASFELVLTEGANTTTINGVGNALLGTTVTVGDYTITVQSGATQNSDPTSFINSVSVLIKDNAASGTQTLTMTLGNTGFTLPTGLNRFLYGSVDNLSVLTGSVTGTYQGFADTNNGQNATSGPGVVQTQLLSFTPATASGATTPVVPFSGSGTYSMTGVATLTTTGGTQITSFGFETDATLPEPGTLAILASGLPMLGFFGLRRRRQAKAKVA